MFMAAIMKVITRTDRFGSAGITALACTNGTLSVTVVCSTTIKHLLVFRYPTDYRMLLLRGPYSMDIWIFEEIQYATING